MTTVDAALLALEADGVVPGIFVPDPGLRIPDPGTQSAPEWCDRSLLARIHRYTLNRLRAEIEPVTPADFMRFLFAWQHVGAPGLVTSIEGLREIVAQLDGFELSASAWERAVLPARMDTYEPQLLDMLCLAGEVGWARLSVPPTNPLNPARLVPATPISLFLREHADVWQRLREHGDAAGARTAGLSDGARRVLDVLAARGHRSSTISSIRLRSMPMRCARPLARSSPRGLRRQTAFQVCAR